MIIKVNLLPRNFSEKRVVQKLAIVFAVLFLLVLGGMATRLASLNTQLTALQQQTAIKQAEAQRVDAVNADIQKIQSQIPILKKRTALVEEIDASNEQWIGLFEDIAKYTYRKVTYKSIAPKENTVTITGHTDSLSSLGRYLLGMLRCPRFTYVSITQGIPGYPKGSSGDSGGGGSEMPGMPSSSFTSSEGGGLDFTVICTMKSQLQFPNFSGGGGASAMGGSGGMGSSPSMPAPSAPSSPSAPSAPAPVMSTPVGPGQVDTSASGAGAPPLAD